MMSHENRKPGRTLTDPPSILVCDRAAEKLLCCPVLTKAQTLLTHYWTILLLFLLWIDGLMVLRLRENCFAYDIQVEME